ERALDAVREDRLLGRIALVERGACDAGTLRDRTDTHRGVADLEQQVGERAEQGGARPVVAAGAGGQSARIVRHRATRRAPAAGRIVAWSFVVSAGSCSSPRHSPRSPCWRTTLRRRARR